MNQDKRCDEIFDAIEELLREGDGSIFTSLALSQQSYTTIQSRAKRNDGSVSDHLAFNCFWASEAERVAAEQANRAWSIVLIRSGDEDEERPSLNVEICAYHSATLLDLYFDECGQFIERD